MAIRSSASIALRLARLRAGYRSAADAAAAIGVSENTLRAHESGKRKVTSSQAAIYGQGFGIDFQSLIDEIASGDEWRYMREVDELTARAKYDPAARQDSQCHRLRFARILRGFSTLSEAAVRLGLSRGTAGSHENGGNYLSDPVVAAYAAAYSINAGWLKTGDGPSGFLAQVDDPIKGVRPSELPELATRITPAPQDKSQEAWAAVRVMFKAAIGGETIGGKILEVDVLADGTTSAVMPRQVWNLPQGVRTKLGQEGAREVVVVILQKALFEFKIGDRLFVDTTDHNLDQRALFMVRYTDGTIDYADNRSRPGGIPRRAHLVGKVVGSFGFM